MKAKDYIKYLMSMESYSFSLEEIAKATNLEKTALKLELTRLTKKQEIINLRKGFYLIIPPRYSLKGHVPIQLYCEKLFKSLNRKYYLGFFTAANFFGAGHQQSQKDYIMIETPMLRDLHKETFQIQFITTNNWPKKNIITKKSDAGYFQVSSPALTMVDLLQHQNKLGGINRILSVLEELSEELTEKDIEALLTWYPFRSTIQRLGYILEETKSDINLDIIYNYLNNEPFYPVLLSPNDFDKPGAVLSKWKVDENIHLGADS